MRVCHFPCAAQYTCSAAPCQPPCPPPCRASLLRLPPCQVYTTRPVQAEEELVCGWSELAEQNLLQESIASRLIASGWRCHVLDAFWLRLCDLAAAKRDALVTGGARVAAGRSLHAALQRAAALYYEQQGGDGGGAGDPGMAPRLAEALEASVREHPPPYCVAALSRVEQPPLEEQFRPLAAARELPPMARRSDFGALPPEVVASLDSAPEARPLDEVGRGVPGAHAEQGRLLLMMGVLAIACHWLPDATPLHAARIWFSCAPAPMLQNLALRQDARRRLRAGDVPTAVVCDIQFRLHRVRCACACKWACRMGRV